MKKIFLLLFIIPFSFSYAEENSNKIVPVGPKPIQRVPIGPMGPMGPTQLPYINGQNTPSNTAKRKAYQLQQQELQKKQEEMLELQKDSKN